MTTAYEGEIARAERALNDRLTHYEQHGVAAPDTHPWLEYWLVRGVPADHFRSRMTCMVRADNEAQALEIVAERGFRGAKVTMRDHGAYMISVWWESHQNQHRMEQWLRSAPLPADFSAGSDGTYPIGTCILFEFGGTFLRLPYAQRPGLSQLTEDELALVEQARRVDGEERAWRQVMLARAEAA